MKEYPAIQVLFKSKKERDKMHERAKESGFNSVSEFLKFCGFNARISIEVGKYSIVESMKHLRDLYKDGLITHTELTEIKKEVLAGESKTMIAMKNKKEFKV